MKIPRKVKIGANIYTVEIVDGDDSIKSCGETIFPTLTIKITRGKQSFMETTFLHEVFHCINNEMGDEHVEFLAQALHGFIQNNKEVFKYGKE